MRSPAAKTCLSGGLSYLWIMCLHRGMARFRMLLVRNGISIMQFAARSEENIKVSRDKNESLNVYPRSLGRLRIRDQWCGRRRCLKEKVQGVNIDHVILSNLT